MGIILLIDSGCDLPLEWIEDNKSYLEVIGMPISIENEGYIDDFGKNLSHNFLYSKLRQGIMPRTSQITAYRFLESFEKHYALGNSILYIGFTSHMSGTFNNAVLAKNTFLAEHPDADIVLVDTSSASIGQGLLIVYALEMLKNGKSKEAIVKWLEENKLSTNHWFAVDDLYYLKNGGRISSTTAVVGSMLNVKPIVIVNQNGELKSYTNIRGRKKSLRYLYNKVKEHIRDDSKIIIGHGNCLEDALKLKDMVLEEITVKEITISELSATIASHVGPNMIAITFMGKSAREDI